MKGCIDPTCSARRSYGCHAHDVYGAIIALCTAGVAGCKRTDFHIHGEDTMDTKQIQIDANKKAEAVNHPAHYGGDTTYETVKVLAAWGLGFLLGNAVKYISRAGKKDGKLVEDLEKARWYLDKAIERLKAGQPVF